MDCKEFRDKHAKYVDLMCSAVEEREFRDHARHCRKCARHDTVVGRSLLLVRNLPVIQPSADFQARLEAKLRAVSAVTVAPPPIRSAYRAFAALAAGVAFVTYLAAERLMQPPAPLRMSPVVATLPAVESGHVATPTFVATVPTGMSVWPAIMAASQAQMHFVAAELASER